MANRQDGFSIIEVLIVLAIVALIILIIFIAIPELKRIERNNERKTAVSHIVAEMSAYYANTGRYPYSDSTPAFDNRTEFVNQILSDGIIQSYDVRYFDQHASHNYPFQGAGVPANPSDAIDEIIILPAHKCNRTPNLNPGDADYPATSTSLNDTDMKSFAVWTLLERGPVFCLDVEN